MEIKGEKKSEVMRLWPKHFISESEQLISSYFYKILNGTSYWNSNLEAAFKIMISFF